MPKLCVSGCSFSNYARNHKVTKTYGELVAQHYNREYIHNAVDAGSNDRIWRTTTNMILDGELTPQDVIIIQYTIKDRQEFWSPNTKINDNNLQELWKDDGSIFRYTAQAEHKVGKEKMLVDTINRFSNWKFNEEVFRVRHNHFMAFLQVKGFEHAYFLKAGMYGPYFEDKDMLIPYFKKKIINGSDLLDKEEYRSDAGHMNQEGHENAARRINRLLKKKGLHG
tara:strand:+ start:5662 stop:6333 length:672 start_codon:yes stop_codon:yes gene_type:complete